MKAGARRFAIVLAAALLAGCAAREVGPAWRLDLRQALEQGSAAELEGRDRQAALHWARAQQAARAASDATALARVSLWRCALQLAAARSGACPAADPYLADAGAAERAYAAWLAGAHAVQPGVDGAEVALPPAPRAVAALGPEPQPQQTLETLRLLDDPLSRLVAGGWLWQAGRLDGQGVALMVDTAAAQGWRRPLAAWLALQQRLAERAGDVDTAARARRRLQWLLWPDAAAAESSSPAR